MSLSNDSSENGSGSRANGSPAGGAKGDPLVSIPNGSSSNALLSHPLLPAVVSSHVFQSFHLTLPVVKPKASAHLHPHQSTPPTPAPANLLDEQQLMSHILVQCANAFQQLRLQKQQQQQQQQQCSGAPPFTPPLFSPHVEDTPSEILFDHSAIDAHDTSSTSDFLIRYAALLQMQQAETELLESTLDTYLHDVCDALALNGRGETPSPTRDEQQQGDAQQQQQQQQMHTGMMPLGAPVTRMQRAPPVQMSPPSPVAAALPSTAREGVEAVVGEMVAGAAGAEANIGQKKPEEVISELKKKYSGHVLQVAQQKKKKKNFTKDATDHLNMWFFNHLGDPYPTDDEKKVLAQATNLTLSQVNNWFGNKRMRYKRKMLEQNRKQGGAVSGGSSAQSMSPGSPDGSPSPMSPQPQPPPQAAQAAQAQQQQQQPSYQQQQQQMVGYQQQQSPSTAAQHRRGVQQPSYNPHSGGQGGMWN